MQVGLNKIFWHQSQCVFTHINKYSPQKVMFFVSTYSHLQETRKIFHSVIIIE